MWGTTFSYKSENFSIHDVAWPFFEAGAKLEMQAMNAWRDQILKAGEIDSIIAVERFTRLIALGREQAASFNDLGNGASLERVV